ncbi:hypothetical protein [Domibacillus enclensis]|uniref:Uncharacterized protein n=1 Tax=Domibacillus enclensis TaxID=1017273 RepID=A0A1N6WGK0_9BACI|nr:hypothetical protein [Domibacillus enclensis]OXS77926.1 hypothetical protein B1B05_09985 [Domibacillus enclensis]SIQ89106.1 hypothetical protein SAMN05443094_104156 [Domibacillus enclensis]
MTPIQGYENLTDTQRKIFVKVHKRHLSMMGETERAKRTLDKVEKLKWNAQEQAVEVYYADGEWWHYNSKGEWY